jgi:ribonuclease HII
VRRITPAQIDGGNLNALEEQAIADLIRAFEPTHVIIDALGHPSTLPKVQARLEAAVAPLRPVWTIVPKADRDHPVCGAASIFAKTTRDAALAETAERWGELGSGYPSDPKVKAWLQAHLATGAPWPSFVRTRWGTVRALEALVEGG